MSEAVTHPSFNWRTHYRNKKTGKISSVQNYTYHIHKSGQQWIERGGKKYNPDGSEYKEAPVPIVVAKPQEVVAAAPTPPVVEAKKPIQRRRRRTKPEPKTPEEVNSVSTDTGHSE